jgi:hypothetical protein
MQREARERQLASIPLSQGGTMAEGASKEAKDETKTGAPERDYLADFESYPEDDDLGDHVSFERRGYDLIWGSDDTYGGDARKTPAATSNGAAPIQPRDVKISVVGGKSAGQKSGADAQKSKQLDFTKKKIAYMVLLYFAMLCYQYACFGLRK